MAHPLTLDDLLSVLAARGILHHLSITRTTDKTWQASMKKPGSSSYAVSIKPELVDAVWGAVSPGYGLSWVSTLGDDLGKMVDAVHFPEDEDDDELEDIL